MLPTWKHPWRKIMIRPRVGSRSWNHGIWTIWMALVLRQHEVIGKKPITFPCIMGFLRAISGGCTYTITISEGCSSYLCFCGDCVRAFFQSLQHFLTGNGRMDDAQKSNDRQSARAGHQLRNNHNGHSTTFSVASHYCFSFLRLSNHHAQAPLRNVCHIDAHRPSYQHRGHDRR